jgi:endonuclease/exonuclease/phosphatase family metal-dependent hydrolase
MGLLYFSTMLKLLPFVLAALLISFAPQSAELTPQTKSVLAEELLGTALPDASIPEKGDALRFVAWNIENFFDVYDDPYRNDQITKPSFPSDQRKQRVADVLKLLDADVVALEEVENRGVLEQFVKEYLPKMGYEVVLIEGNDRRGIDNALLSRLPIGAVTSYRHLKLTRDNGSQYQFGRDLLRVHIADWETDVFVVHFKSQHGGRKSDSKRQAEAAKVAEILNAERAGRPGYRAIVAGDFNEVRDEDNPERKPNQEHGAVTMLLNTGLIDACAGQPQFSYNKEPYLTRIDFALLTPSLAKEMVVAKVIPLIDGVDMQCTSDHFPVLVDFKHRR